MAAKFIYQRVSLAVMPEILPGTYKPQLDYYWVRQLQDGSSIETEFDLDTGRRNDWYPEPKRLTKICWMPFFPELADKVSRWGEYPTCKPIQRIEFDLDPDKVTDKVEFSGFFHGVTYSLQQNRYIGESPVCYRREHVHMQPYYHCTLCNHDFFWDRDSEAICPQCGAKKIEWYCDVCDEVKDKPLEFDRGEMRCPDCELRAQEFLKGLWDGSGDPPKIRGLLKLTNIEKKAFIWIETAYVLGIEDVIELEVGTEVIRPRREDFFGGS